MERGFSPERRRWLRIAGGLGLGAAAGVLAASGCAKPAPAPAPERVEPVRVPLAELPEGQRVIVMLGRKPIELVRTGDSVRARSLWCTHMGCAVAWNEAQQRYRCRCHEGVFDADGQPLSGPPPKPLREAPYRREGDALVLLPTGTA